MKPTKIILHHSLTKDSGSVSWGAIRNYHINTNGWSDIGYHFGIEDVQGEMDVLVGRMPDRTGAHCYGYNRNSIGVCFVGNFDIHPPPILALEKGKELIKYLMSVYSIEHVLGHVELNSGKSCPGRKFPLEDFKRSLIS